MNEAFSTFRLRKNWGEGKKIFFSLIAFMSIFAGPKAMPATCSRLPIVVCTQADWMTIKKERCKLYTRPGAQDNLQSGVLFYAAGAKKLYSVIFKNKYDICRRKWQD